MSEKTTGAALEKRKAEFEGAKDPITFAVIYNRLLTINREMGITMINTSISPIFAEAHDFSCAVCDWDCRIVSQVDGVPSHTASAMESVKAIVKYFGDDIHPGDVFVLNDPYMGGTHLQDVTIMKPIFFGGRLQFIAINRAHHGDVGGMEPGSYCPKATELFHEGVRIPPLRIYSGDEPIMDVINMIRINTRMPEEIWVDMKAQVASCNVGEKRILEMMEKYGEEKTRETIEDIHLYAENRMRDEIGRLPDGVYHGHATLDGDGLVDEPLDIKVKITIQGRDALVDFEGTSPQCLGPSNSPLANTATCVYVAFLTTVTTPDIPHNEGVYRPIRITAPEGSVVNPSGNAPVAYCTLDTACAILEACWMALADILPGRVPAGWNRWNGPTVSGVDPRNENFYVMFGFNGFGGAGGAQSADGRPYIGDGIDLGGLIAPNIETNEVDYPHITEFNEFTEDSCGAGEYRGGNGARYRIKFYDGAETNLVMFGDGRVNPPYGLFGGLPGTCNMAYINEGLAGEELLPAKGAVTLTDGGTFTSYPSGGGGWGDPKKRPAEKVAMDVKNGYISRRAAQEIYGVALTEGFGVDAAATAKLRG
ncbi:MAG: hydantoinase B/oxoprolinase family protein [Lachnospiraceae bacterium]|jgi:N-methylhydantoinase B|nr:hydantoinase B/oxoprolinase family protein [Lachnospiraceae bacterium]